MTRRVPALDVVEAAYDLASDDETWGARLLDAARPHFDRGLGLYLSVYAEQRPDAPLLVRMEPSQLAALSASFLAALPERAQRHFLESTQYRSLLSILREVEPRSAETWLDLAAPYQVRDAIGLAAHDLEGHSLQLCGVSASVEVPTKPTTTIWSRVAAHLGAALRLRLRRAQLGADCVAVLTPSGAFEHADAEVAASATVREALAVAVVGRERARTRGRAADGDTLAEWPTLVRSRYSLVDQVDPNGTRRVLAPRNRPRLEPVLQLSPTQRVMAELVRRGLSNKQIAYALGVSEGHVAATLHGAMARLGVRSRVALVKATAGVGDTARLRPLLAQVVSHAQVEVALMALAGSSHRTIAAARGVSERTVANQLAEVYRAFGVRSKGELAARLAG